MHDNSDLPGSSKCVGCRGMTFRQRTDGLCPRCAFEAEHLMERIELDCLSYDLQLITEFEAYYAARERAKKSGFKITKLDKGSISNQAFYSSGPWPDLRDVI